jgi:hypothetical protein
MINRETPRITALDISRGALLGLMGLFYVFIAFLMFL